MRSKLRWTTLSGLVAVVLVLASCGPALVEEEEEEEEPGTVTEEAVEEEAPQVEEEAVAEDMVRDSLGRLVEKPQYGGSVHVAWDLDSLPGFQPDAYTLPSTGSLPVYESLFVEDYLMGPSGTSEIPLDATYTPMLGMRAALAVSWEQTDLTTIVFHIREGVHFQNKPPVNGREMTAHDWVFSLYQTQANPQGSWYKPPDTPAEELYQATALDKWTVEVKLPGPDPFVISRLGGDIVVMPHEVVDEYGGFEDWRVACGTGAFTVDEAVIGSSVTYKRNPNYWMTNPLHPEDTLPYIDYLKIQLIRDPATRLAALRTGKVDRGSAKREDAALLFESNPELNYRKIFPTATSAIFLRTDIEPMSDMRVRQAVMLAINHEEVRDDFYGGEAEILTWPLMPTAGTAYTPMDELPTEPQIPGSTVSCRELFTYNPEKAKQLLAEAGYPSGFKLHLRTAPAQFLSEHIPILTSYWDAVGMKTEVELMEESALYGSTMTVTYPMVARCNWGNAVPLYAFEYAYRSGHPWNSSGIVDPYIDETWDTIKMTLDDDERNQMWNDLNLYAMEMGYYAWLPGAFSYTFWQPWLKGFSGEVQIGRLWNYTGPLQYVWIDQELKTMMGR